jgi:hypothetical protein
MSRAAISFLLHLGFDSLKDHEVAASVHADTPAKDEPVTAGSATPYTTPVDVNRFLPSAERIHSVHQRFLLSPVAGEVLVRLLHRVVEPSEHVDP